MSSACKKIVFCLMFPILSVFSQTLTTLNGRIPDSSQEAFIAKHSYQKILIQNDHVVHMTALISSVDLNDDGIDDFIVGFMADPISQLGIPCCEVPRSRLGDLKKVPAQLVLSGPNGYRTMAIPESESFRTWAGEFFQLGGNTYYYLGKNGEVGLPKENAGEKSLLYKITRNDRDISFEKLWESSLATVTSSVSVYINNGLAYILENNYGRGSINSSPKGVYDTVMYKFDGTSMVGISLPNRLKERSADNNLRLVDFDNDGKIDLLAAAEVWKSLDGKELMTSWPESYVISDIFSQSTKIPLSPAAFDKDHAGMAIGVLRNRKGSVIVEISSRFYGHQAGGFKGIAINGYQVNDGMKPVPINGILNSLLGTFRDLHELDLNGLPLLVPGYYSKVPQSIQLTEELQIKISNIPVKNFDQGYVSAIIPLRLGDCRAFATTSAIPKSKKISISISSCLN